MPRGGGLLTQGATALFDYHDCVGTATYPCTNDDTLELVVERDGAYLQPGDVVVLVREPGGRTGTKWRTGKTSYHDRDVADTPGVEATFSFPVEKLERIHLDDQRRVAEATARRVYDPGQQPGNLYGSGRGYEKVPDGKSSRLHNGQPISCPPGIQHARHASSTANRWRYQGRHGLHRYRHLHLPRRPGTRTWRWRDAGASPEAGGSQRAYTVMAVNNGPDPARAVEVTLTGIPQGAQVIASEGRYVEIECQNGVCEGDWIIGDLGTPDVRRSTGLSEGPTLTLVAATGGDPVTATIDNMEDYCVRIETGAFFPGGFRNDLSGDLACVGTEPAGYTDHRATYYDHR